jgi:hypothetical protein
MLCISKDSVIVYGLYRSFLNFVIWPCLCFLEMNEIACL